MSTVTVHNEHEEITDVNDDDKFYTVVDQEYRIVNKSSAFFGSVFELIERVPWRDGTVSLWLAHPEFGTLSFPSTDCEFHNAKRRRVPYPEGFTITRHDNGNPE